MEQAIAEGAQVLLPPRRPLIAACRKIAAKHPGIRILNCSVSMPYTGVRTYYSRIYEGKFITGAIAGAMAQNDRVGYVASYPIFGVPAGINAFALGGTAGQSPGPDPASLVLHPWQRPGPFHPSGHFRHLQPGHPYSGAASAAVGRLPGPAGPAAFSRWPPPIGTGGKFYEKNGP